MMKNTPFIFWRSIFQNDQKDSYIECLRLLEGKTNRCIVTFRQIGNGLEMLPELVSIAKGYGITLEGGLELEYAWLPHESQKVTWSTLWRTPRWLSIAENAKKIANIAGIKQVTIVQEPVTDGYLNGEPIDWDQVQLCYRILYEYGINPRFENPVIWADEPGKNYRSMTERYIKVMAKSFGWGQYNVRSSATWACSYAHNPATATELMAKHKKIVGPSRFHERIFAHVAPAEHFEWDMDKTNAYIANNKGTPPVIYPTYKGEYDGTQVCEALYG